VEFAIPLGTQNNLKLSICHIILLFLFLPQKEKEAKRKVTAV